MRTALMVLLLSGVNCRTANLQITPKIVDGRLKFDFRSSPSSSKSPAVNGISVFEVAEERRGETVCSIDRRSRLDTAEIGEWKYGEVVAGFDVIGCGLLKKEMPYGVSIVGPYGSGVAFFVLKDDGSVRTVEHR